MLNCTLCHAKQLDGTIFCNECGKDLTELDAVQTTPPLGISFQQASPQPMPRLTPQTQVLPQTGTPVVTLVVSTTHRQYRISLRGQVLIGRADPSRGIMPDIDLTPDGGLAAGVSRQHARLFYRDGAYLVEDLGSANGTYINGRKTAPQAAMSLHHGDEVCCGGLQMRIQLQPATSPIFQA